MMYVVSNEQPTLMRIVAPAVREGAVSGLAPGLESVPQLREVGEADAAAEPQALVARLQRGRHLLVEGPAVAAEADAAMQPFRLFRQQTPGPSSLATIRPSSS